MTKDTPRKKGLAGIVLGKTGNALKKISRFGSRVLPLAGLLMASAPTYPATSLPDHYGVFGVSKDKVVELKRERKLEGELYSTFSGTTHVVGSADKPAFIIHGPGFESPELHRIMLLNVDIDSLSFIPRASYKVETFDMNGNLSRNGIMSNKVPLKLYPVKGESNMVRAESSEPLKNGLGLYLLSVGGCTDNLINFRCCFPVLFAKSKKELQDFSNLIDTFRNRNQIMSALSLYYGDNEGNFPSKLEDLVPNYLSTIPPARLTIYGHPVSSAVKTYPGGAGADCIDHADHPGGSLPACVSHTGGWNYAPSRGRINMACDHSDFLYGVTPFTW